MYLVETEGRGSFLKSYAKNKHYMIEMESGYDYGQSFDPVNHIRGGGADYEGSLNGQNEEVTSQRSRKKKVRKNR